MKRRETQLLALLHRLYKAGGEPVPTGVLAARIGLQRESVSEMLNGPLADKIEILSYYNDGTSGGERLYKPRGKVKE